MPQCEPLQETCNHPPSPDEHCDRDYDASPPQNRQPAATVLSPKLKLSQTPTGALVRRIAWSMTNKR